MGAMHMACPGVPDVTPYAALPPALPMLCDTLNTGVPATFTQGANSWVDEFNHGASMADMGTGYQIFDALQVAKTGHFRHNQHWMVDMWAPNNGFGSAMMRPDRTFKFENGKLVVEAVVAAGVHDYETADAWPEIVVTTSSSPFGANRTAGPTPAKSTGDALYAYGHFGGYDAMGIRLTANRRPIEAYYDDTQRGFQCGRVWELSWFQNGNAGCSPTVTADVYGGGEWVQGGNAWRTCQGTDPDTNCRDLFRWELTKTQITLYVNGVKYMQHTAGAGQRLVPDSFLNGNVYVYFADTVYQPPQDRVVRFHWDRLAVNP
jgi:hypothetical protein